METDRGNALRMVTAGVALACRQLADGGTIAPTCVDRCMKREALQRVLERDTERYQR